jgi:hypothetical protein
VSDGLSRFGVSYNDHTEWSSISVLRSLTLRRSDGCFGWRNSGDHGFEMTSDAVDANEKMLGYLWCRRWGIGHGGVILLGRALPLLTFGRGDMCPAMVAQGCDKAVVESGCVWRH